MVLVMKVRDIGIPATSQTLKCVAHGFLLERARWTSSRERSRSFSERARFASTSKRARFCGLRGNNPVAIKMILKAYDWSSFSLPCS